MPTASIAELAAHLLEQGVDAEPLRVAAALIGLARAQGWAAGDGAHASTWLGELAAEVARARHTRADCPSLATLQSWLAANGVDADARKAASALLGLAHAEDWNRHPEHLIHWFARVAAAVSNPEMADSSPLRTTRDC